MFWVLQWAQSAGTTVQRGFRHLTHWLHNDFAQINHPLMRSANIDGYVTLLQLVLQGPNKNTVCVYARACRSVFANRKPVPERVNFFFIRFPISYSFLIHFLFSVIYGSVCFFATLPLSPPWLRPSVYRHPCQILFLPRSYLAGGDIFILWTPVVCCFYAYIFIMMVRMTRVTILQVFTICQPLGHILYLSYRI